MAKKSILVALSLACMLFGAAPLASAADFNIRFAHDGAPDAVYSQTYRKFGELAAKYTDGKVKVKIYENAVLGGDREVTESTQRGDLQMGGCGTSNVGIFWPSATAFDLPFIIDPAKKEAYLRALMNGELGKYINEQLAKVNLKALVFADCGFRHYMTNKKVITDPSSLKNVKMRTTASPVDNLTAETLGMIPCPMGFGEVYTALQQGTVDGELIGIGDYYAARRGDVIHNALLTSHNYTIMIGFISKSYWDSLPADVQAGLKKAADEATEFAIASVGKLEQEGLKYAADNKLAIAKLSAEQRAAFVEAVKPVYAKYLPNIDPKFYELLTATQK